MRCGNRKVYSSEGRVSWEDEYYMTFQKCSATLSGLHHDESVSFLPQRGFLPIVSRSCLHGSQGNETCVKQVQIIIIQADDSDPSSLYCLLSSFTPCF